MRKIYCILAVVFVLNTFVSAFAESEPQVIATYTSSFTREQGVNNWYFCEFTNSGIKELKYINGRWQNGVDEYPNWNSDGGTINTGTNIDASYKFVAPEKGMVRLRGKVNMPLSASLKGTGVAASIYKESKKLWSGTANYGKDAEYDIITSVKRGEELYFRVNPNGNNYYDWTIWWPTVEYLGIDYVSDEEVYTYLQKKDGQTTELNYDDKADGYYAADGIAFISDRGIMPTEEYSLVKRYVVPEDGRFRVYATVDAADSRSGGNVITVYKNGDEVWKQLFPDDEDGILDVRIFSAVGDIIDVEVSAYEYAGYNYNKWRCDITKYIGTLFCEASTGAGYVHGTLKQFSLSSLIGTNQGQNGISCFTVRRDLKKPMIYNSSASRWENGDPDFVATVTSGLANKGQIGYITPTSVFPGDGTDSVIEWNVPEDGILRVDGDMSVSAGDGVLSKIFKNGELLWSSRVGGERPVRWDEPFDVSYFLNKVNIVTDVKTDDKITFLFNQWRRSSNDIVDISNITLSYVSGNVLSETTRWKLNNSIVIDTEKECVYSCGKCESADAFVKDGTTYISKNDALKILGKEIGSAGVKSETEYISVRDTAEKNDKSVVWTADRLVLIYSGIPVFFGYSELSEIDVALKGGVLFE